jgi:hypothetical protein
LRGNHGGLGNAVVTGLVTARGVHAAASSASPRLASALRLESCQLALGNGVARVTGQRPLERVPRCFTITQLQ